MDEKHVETIDIVDLEIKNVDVDAQQYLKDREARELFKAVKDPQTQRAEADAAYERHLNAKLKRACLKCMVISFIFGAITVGVYFFLDYTSSRIH